MVYYELGKDVEPKVVGVTHGAGQLRGDDDFTKLNSWKVDQLRSKEYWKTWAKCELYAPKPLVGLLLEKKAKKTDFVGTNDLVGFYVNDRLKSILEDAHLPNHKFLPTVFTSEKTGELIEEYWQFVYDLETGEDTIDFSKCEYNLDYHKQKFGDDFTVDIKSYKDYIDVFLKTGSALKTSKLVFNSSFDKELDIFGTQFLSTQNAYLSERMLRKWQSEQVTGYTARSPEASKRRAKFFPDSYCELIFHAA